MDPQLKPSEQSLWRGLTESRDVLIDARLNRAQRVMSDAMRKLALGAGGKSAGYVADPLDDVGGIPGREIRLLHSELEKVLARDAKRLAHHVHLVVSTRSFAEGHVVSRSQPPLAARRHEIGKILGVIVAVVKHHVEHDPLESDRLLPHVIAAELGRA